MKGKGGVWTKIGWAMAFTGVLGCAEAPPRAQEEPWSSMPTVENLEGSEKADFRFKIVFERVNSRILRIDVGEGLFARIFYLLEQKTTSEDKYGNLSLNWVPIELEVP